jgi:hypothetical protein
MGKFETLAVKSYKRSWDTDVSLLKNHLLPRFGKRYMDEFTLGHTQVKTTQRYAHLSQDTLLAAANSATTALGAAMMPVVQPARLAA